MHLALLANASCGSCHVFALSSIRKLPMVITLLPHVRLCFLVGRLDARADWIGAGRSWKEFTPYYSEHVSVVFAS